MAPAAKDQQPEAGLGLDTVEHGLERLELATHKAGAESSDMDTGADSDDECNGACHDREARITDVDPLSIDLPAAIAQLAEQVERIPTPAEAAPLVARLTRWAAAPQIETVGETLDAIAALLLVEGLGQGAIDPLRTTHGPAEWTDGRLTVAVAMVFRPLLVDLVARWTLPTAPAAVFCHLGPRATAEQAQLCVAYAAGLLLPTAPQIRTLLTDYFAVGAGAAIVAQVEAHATADADAALNVLVVLCRLLRVLPEA
ncbi:hypothetical protein H4R19_005175, partial [Coemansia spiralis]